MTKRDEDIRVSFGVLFFVVHRLETLIDRYLAPHDLTTKQFFLSLVLLQHGDQRPALTLSQAAERMGTSRQNVKQLALKLKARGFCAMKPDETDQRILRLAITRKNAEFWKALDDENVRLLRRLFGEIGNGTLHSMARGLSVLLETVEKLEGEYP